MKKFFDIVACIHDKGVFRHVFIMDTDLNPKEHDIVEFEHEFYIVQEVRKSEYLDPEFLDFLVHNGRITGTAKIIYHREFIQEDAE